MTLLSMDFFKRQRSVPDWDQPLIEQQRVLVLGVGGTGCSIARNLCRLGISELFLVDFDDVATSNVNRQVLFSPGDVGRKKTEAAIEGLERDNIQTKISVLDFNAVTEWRKIIDLATMSTAIFNCIDYGEYMDYAVTSLCVALGLPYAAASSYGHTAIVESFPVPDHPRQGPCWACNNAPSQIEVLRRVTPDKILTQGCLDFLPKDSHMPTTQDVGSSVLVCSLAASMAVGAWLNALHGYQLPNWMSCDFASFQLFSYPVEANPSCLVCQNAPRYSPGVISVFFGTTEVKLSAVAGETITYSKGSITDPNTESHTESSRLRLDPCTDLGEEYSSCYLPAIPSADLEMSSTTGDTSQLPSELNTPLLKVEGGTIKALKSGGRSAILPATHTCYRLKGCGNYLDAEGYRHPFPGFPLEKLEAKDGVEIRGCCFKHTAVREQYMSDLVGEVLGGEGISVGNKPIAMWQYHIPTQPLPKVGKWCGIFETLGERRLSSHLLTGLEALLPVLFPSITTEQVLALFPPERLVVGTPKSTCEVKPTWSACCGGGKELCSPVSMCTTPLVETPPTGCHDRVPPHLREQWCRAAFTLRQLLPLEEADCFKHGSLTALLYWQLGWEVGVVKRLLEANDINWGYFIDHNPFEPHCNSHPNNFVVLPPGNGRFLAPVDFDLSFVREGFFSPYSGTRDDSLFDSWLASEHTEMERALGGEDVNTGVGVESNAEPCHISPVHTALSWAFRDTLLSGYRCSYLSNKDGAEGRHNPYPVPPKLTTALGSLVRLALMVTESRSS